MATLFSLPTVVQKLAQNQRLDVPTTNLIPEYKRGAFKTIFRHIFGPGGPFIGKKKLPVESYQDTLYDVCILTLLILPHL